MSKVCPENEAIKRRYVFFLEATDGLQGATVDAALRAIERFELSTRRKPFSKFHIEQARAFRAALANATGSDGKPLSAATVTSTLKRLRHFFGWLSSEPGYRSKVRRSDAAYFTPSEQDRRIAGAKRTGRVPTLEEILKVLADMPTSTPIEQRNRALIAFAILTGARDGALATFRLKHVDLEALSVFHDGREVKTKGRKTYRTHFFPVGAEPLDILKAYFTLLRDELGFGPEDPLFPATLVGQDADRYFCGVGLARHHWKSAAPIRAIFRVAFEAAGIPYSNPHSYRKTLARLGQSLCRSPEEWKAWSQKGWSSAGAPMLRSHSPPAAAPQPTLSLLPAAPCPAPSPPHPPRQQHPPRPPRAPAATPAGRRPAQPPAAAADQRGRKAASNYCAGRAGWPRGVGARSSACSRCA